MKKLNAYVNNQESGKIVGQIVNVIIAITGLMFCIYGVYIQVTNNL